MEKRRLRKVLGTIAMWWIFAAVIAAGLQQPGQVKTGSIPDGILTQNAYAADSLFNVHLDGVTEYELAEIFGKVVRNTPGVIEFRRYSSKIIPDNPGASFVRWRVKVASPDPGRLQRNIMAAIRRIAGSGGSEDASLLQKIRPGNISGTDIRFLAGH